MSTTIHRIDPEARNAAAAVIKVLGHPLRLELLEAMESGEQTVSDLQAFTGATQTMVSQQLGILRGRGVVDARREGPFVYYHITEPRVQRVLACVRECEPRARSTAPHRRIG
jgi:DNA-binding transcriptional ArsR family regulator